MGVKKKKKEKKKEQVADRLLGGIPHRYLF